MICSRVLDRNGPLWNEARSVLEGELRQSGVYFSILEQLATGAKEVERIASGARIENSIVSRYLATLADLRIVRREFPAGAAPSSRGGHCSSHQRNPDIPGAVLLSRICPANL